jgi:hypothetical protein
MRASSFRRQVVNWRKAKCTTLRRRLLGSWICWVALGGVLAQEPAMGSEPGRGQEGDKQALQKPANHIAQPSVNVTTDNLDRVAASAKQILEILNRDAGLMVEFKHMIAVDASASGQLLEESDMDESARAERLSEDLRTRVLATRLLQRYGYLVPKLNPDSEMAAEHNLAMRERAKDTEGTTGPGNAPPQTPKPMPAASPLSRTRRPGRDCPRWMHGIAFRGGRRG